jgi:hypothetical protein
MRRITRFPLSHMFRMSVISGIIIVIRNVLRWRGAPKDYGHIRRSTTGSSLE